MYHRAVATLDEDLHRRMRILVAVKGKRTLREAYNEAVRAYLEREEATPEPSAS